MTQFQYSHPPINPGPWIDPLAAARRAGVAVFVLAALALLGGLGMGIIGLTVQFDQIPLPPNMKMPELPPGVTLPQMMRIAFIVLGASALGIGLGFAFLGIFVRRGARWASVLCVVLCVALLGFELIFALASLGGNGEQLGAALCFLAIPVIATIIALACLVDAIRRYHPALAQAQQQYMMQMWQYQQQQAAYRQGPMPPLSPSSVPGTGVMHPPLPTAPSQPADPWQREYGFAPPPPPPPQA